MGKFATVAMILFIAGSIANAEQSPDGKIRQGQGVAQATAELATMELIKGCLGMPLVEAGVVTFDGIEELKFSPMPNGTTMAYGKCVYKPIAK